jgi:hypothetical protein
LKNDFLKCIFLKAPIIWQRLCQYRLSQDDIQKFKDAIDQDYMFEMFVDELPIVGFVGDKEEVVEKFADHKHNSTKYYLYTHLAFSIAYNGGHVRFSFICIFIDSRKKRLLL